MASCTTDARKSNPASKDVRAFHTRARGVLKHPVVELTNADTQTVGAAFAEAIRNRRYTCYACAIMPDHVHLLIRKHRHSAEDMVAALQKASGDALRRVWAASGRGGHPVWGGPGWKVFLDCPDDVRRTIDYIEQNPGKLRRPVQRWAFVRP
ncbi:MAG: transposase [Planctomycetota bacterium]